MEDSTIDLNIIKLYCLKCKKHSDIKEYEQKETKNNRLYVQGLCHCGTKCNKFIKRDKKIEKLLSNGDENQTKE